MKFDEKISIEPNREIGQLDGMFDLPLKTADGPTEILSHFKRLIAEGRLRPGTPLPSERDLAPMLGVSRPTLRQVLKALHLLGVLDTKPRNGTYVTERTSDIMKAPLHFAVLLKDVSNEERHKELMDTRTLLEVHLAGLAAENATQEDLEAMRRELAALLQAMGKAETWCSYEIRFHEALARAAKNSVMISIMEMLAELLYEQRHKTVESLTDYHESFQLHYRIFEQIQKRDRKAAEDAMRAHFEQLQARTGLNPEPPTEEVPSL